MLHAKIAIGFSLIVFGFSQDVLAHEGHEHDDSALDATTSVAGEDREATPNSFTANGKSYAWKHRPDLGKQSDQLIKAAKGGLHNSADQDLKTKEIVTVVAKHGLVALDAELQQWKLVEGQDKAFAGGMNSHGADCFLLDDESYWAFASTNTGEVVVSQRGKIVANLTKPKGTEFDNPTVNKYFRLGGKFTPCDVVYLPVAKRLVVVIGYAPGDFALSAELQDGQWKWGGPAWGGKEKVGGLFSTAHGVEVTTVADQEVVEVASRAHGRLFAFTSDGAQIKMPGADKEYYLGLPKGSTPCDISHARSSLFVPLLSGAPKGKDPASVLVLENGKVSGSLTPATYEDLAYMLHMHGFCAFEKDGKLFGVVLSWRAKRQHNNGDLNDGRIEIFEAVEQKTVEAVPE